MKQSRGNVYAGSESVSEVNTYETGVRTVAEADSAATVRGCVFALSPGDGASRLAALPSRIL